MTRESVTPSVGGTEGPTVVSGVERVWVGRRSPSISLERTGSPDRIRSHFFGVVVYPRTTVDHDLSDAKARGSVKGVAEGVTDNT